MIAHVDDLVVDWGLSGLDSTLLVQSILKLVAQVEVPLFDAHLLRFLGRQVCLLRLIEVVIIGLLPVDYLLLLRAFLSSKPKSEGLDPVGVGWISSTAKNLVVWRLLQLLHFAAVVVHLLVPIFADFVRRLLHQLVDALVDLFVLFVNLVAGAVVDLDQRLVVVRLGWPH